MWAALGKWLIGTKMGRGVLIGVSVALGAFASWYFFSTHYYDKGVAACKAEQLKDTNDANVTQANKNEKSNAVSSEVGKKATAAADKVNTGVEASVATRKEDIEDAYRKPANTAPVSLGSCVHPVPARVQSRIGEARRAANKAGGS